MMTLKIYKSMILLFYLFVLKIIVINAKPDLCGSNGIDLSILNHGTIWNLTHIQNNRTIDLMLSLCKPFDKFDVNSKYKECDNKSICLSYRENPQVIGYDPKAIVQLGTSIESISVLFEGPICDNNKDLNYSLSIRFTCGPHLEYPRYYLTSKCKTILEWRTSAACKKKPIHNEVKCYVYDNENKRRDLTPLIKPNGGYYKVLSANEEFYINVCSDASSICSGNESGACIRDASNKLLTVGNYEWSEMKFKSKSAGIPYSHIELTYKSKSNRCNYKQSANSTSKTTIRFICPSSDQRKSYDFLDRNPKLVSNLDCNYQIEWMTEFACPLEQIEVEANSCILDESKHGFDFNLKSLLKKNSSEEYYKISDIKLNGSTDLSAYDIYLNVCGGLGSFKCGDKQWATNSVCLKSKDGKTDKVIGSVSGGRLLFADNKLTLKYTAKDSVCKYGENMISESTHIEFLCDDTNGSDIVGKPEFVSFEDCVYTLEWKTPLVCPITASTIPCAVTHKDMTFDLSPLKKDSGSNPWTAGVAQSLPWSRHAKSEKDTIFLNICGLLPKTPNTTSCDSNSSACMTIGTTNTTVNLGKFSSSPRFNEDIKALELVYDNGFDRRTKKKITTKITLRCKPGNLDSPPLLIDIDEALGIYEFEWQTAAACPVHSVEGKDCKVYDQFLDYTFDLNELKAKTYYPIKSGDYEFQINVCGPVISSTCNEEAVKNVVGPFGACQVENNGDKRAFSLGKANYSLIYWNGIINLTFTEGTPYRNKEKTPRKSQIAFICDPHIGKGHPEFDGERDRSYFFRWYTSLACPHTPKTVHCVWDNGSHIVDLTPLSNTQGNHFTVGIGRVPAIYYINICRPLNPIHDNTLKDCGPNSAVCKVTIGVNNTLSLGEATQPPISGFDGSINLFYHNGSPCPTNANKRLSSRIKFICDPYGDSLSPTVIEPGNEEMDGEECVYLFEWRTPLVCKTLEPIKTLDSCVYTDPRTSLSVDLTSLRKLPNSEPYKVLLSQNKSTFELNVCGTANSFASPLCTNASVCFRSSNQSVFNYGSFTSSSFFFDGNDLSLKYSNGSKCPHTDSGKMSTEIIFKCNPESKKSEPKLHGIHSCIAVFHWETDLVCSLQLPKCSILNDNNFYNLRQLSTISHAWNTTDKEGNVYLLNVCTKLPLDSGCNGLNAASCKCTYDANNKLDCLELGDPSSDELSIRNGSLLLTYKDGKQDHCGKGTRAQTQITFKCGEQTGKPKFIEFIKSKCIYKFEWITFMACSVNGRNDLLLDLNNGRLEDKRINALIDIQSLMNKTFNVNETERSEKYIYVINLSKPQFKDDSKCSKAAICQTKPNSDFKRDIGSIDSIKYYLKGHELQIVLTSTDPKKCGKNKNKNVTSIIRLQCSSSAGLGEPYFVYESNDCDYVFNWETEIVCPKKFVDVSDNGKDDKNLPNDENSKPDKSQSEETGHSRVWIGVVIILLILVTLAVLFLHKQRARQSLMFRFRRLFTPETDHTFHYHQLASYEKDRENEVAFINCNDNCNHSINRNTVAAQPSKYVPYYSIYDDSDVDLLT